jgi:CRP-like cAMP-binding protein
MPDTSKVLDEARALVEKRLSELDQERRRLERALADLTGGRVGRRRPGRPRGTAAGGRRRQRRGGTRADQAVKLVKAKPGITASEMASQMKIKPNYLYRVLGDLQKEGKVSKRGRKYHPKG